MQKEKNVWQPDNFQCLWRLEIWKVWDCIAVYYLNGLDPTLDPTPGKKKTKETPFLIESYLIPDWNLY